MEVRNGFQEYATGFPSNDQIDTLMQYIPSSGVAPITEGPSNTAFFLGNMAKEFGTPDKVSPLNLAGAKLFASQSGEVYDVTDGGTGPWTAETGISGSWFSWTNYSTVGGQFLVAASLEGGYFIYDGTAWTAPVAGDGTSGTISGVDPIKIVFVTVWKRRIWVIEEGSTRAWYLPVGQITGIFKKWDFGEQFARGGYLQMLAGWTQDAGVGIDDYLVVASSQGDIGIYEGFDPDNAPTDFRLRGVWYVGPLPVGNRVMDPYGGDLLILSTRGVTKVSELLTRGEADSEQTLLTHKINKVVSSSIVTTISALGWSVRFLYPQLLIALIAPYNLNNRETMLVQDEVTHGWSVLVDHPCTSVATINGTTFCGSHDGRVVLGFNGRLDDRAAQSEEGNTIYTRLVTAYGDLNEPGLQKHVKLLRLSFTGALQPDIVVTPLLNYQSAERPLVPTVPAVDIAKWDAGKWDAAVWAGGGVPLNFWLGVAGVGFAIAMQMEVTSHGGLLFTQYDWMYEAGDPL
jgi:hypothetical protein